MATTDQGSTSRRIRVGARAVGLVSVLAVLAACSAGGVTAPRSAGLDKWDGEPVFMPAETNCAMTPSLPVCR
jgi:hypothetical protein